MPFDGALPQEALKAWMEKTDEAPIDLEVEFEMQEGEMPSVAAETEQAASRLLAELAGEPEADEVGEIPETYWEDVPDWVWEECEEWDDAYDDVEDSAGAVAAARGGAAPGPFSWRTATAASIWPE